MEASTRTYAGRSGEERRADRRRRLLAAALGEFGSTGYRSARVRDVCRRARVTERSFYELFDSLEDLLLALYDELIGEHIGRVIATIEGELGPREQIRRGIEAAVADWLADRRKARIVMLEVVGVSPRTEQRRHATVAAYVSVLAPRIEGAGAAGDAAGSRRLAVALVGSVIESIVHQLVCPPEQRDRPEQVAATLVSVYESVLGAD